MYFFKKVQLQLRGGKLKEWNAKNRTEKNLNFSWDILRIQSDKTPIGLHGDGGKSNLSDRGH